MDKNLQARSKNLTSASSLYTFSTLAGTERISVPEVFLAEKLISQSTGWVERSELPIEIWQAGKGLVLRVKGFRDFFIAPEGKAILPVEGCAELSGLEEEVVLGPALVLALALGGKWSLHASAARYGDDGLVFLGESGYGKSTLAGYLQASGSPDWQRIADDILPVTVEDGRLTGWPHFPQLKLPAEMQPANYMPEQVKLDRVYLLAPAGPEGKLALETLSRDEGARVLLAHTAGARLFTPELLAGHLAFCAQAAQTVQFYCLSYPHRRDILPEVREMLEQSTRDGQQPGNKDQ